MFEVFDSILSFFKVSQYVCRFCRILKVFEGDYSCLQVFVAVCKYL